MHVVVIGAGILGSSVAYHLAREGAEVDIVDQVHEGKATLAGAGIVCPWATSVEDDPWYRLYAAGARYYPELVDRLSADGETDFGYARVGALVVADDKADLDAAEERVMRRTRDVPEAGEIRRLPPREARALFPPLREGQEAIHIPGAARVNGRDLAAAMLRAAIGRGARYHRERATLVRSQGGASVSLGSGAILAADEIVVTAGAWASELLGPLGLSHPVAPQKGQIVHLRLEGTATAKWPVLLPMNSYYMLAFDDSRVVIGATRETGSGFDYRVTAAGQSEVLNAGLALAPGLADASLIETRVGFRPAASSLRPILGRPQGIDGVIVGNGLGASGLTIGPLAGRLLAEMALSTPPAIDIAAFAPGVCS